MHRAQVLLDDWQYDALRSLAERKRRSISDVLREILTSALAASPAPAKKALRRIGGMGSDRHASGEAHDRFLYAPRKR
jgi:hypothetical protein